MVKIRFINIPSNANASPRKPEYYYRYDALPDYLKPVQVKYLEPSDQNITDPDSSGLDAILTSNKTLIMDKLAMLQTALYERRNIQYDIFKGIESDSTWCQNKIFSLEGWYDPTLSKDWERKKLDLTREYRQEKASYFRDLTMIQKDIRDTMIEYLNESQMEKLL